MTAHDAGYAMGQAIFGLIVPLFVLAGIVWGVVALMRGSKKTRREAPVDAALLMRFALLPGEGHGPVWHAAHPSGEPMIATITSTGVFALNYSIAQAPPVRLRREGAAVSFGFTHPITMGAAEPMLDVTLAGPGQPPLSFCIAQSGAKALSAWAVPVA